MSYLSFSYPSPCRSTYHLPQPALYAQLRTCWTQSCFMPIDHPLVFRPVFDEQAATLTTKLPASVVVVVVSIPAAFAPEAFPYKEPLYCYNWSLVLCLMKTNSRSIGYRSFISAAQSCSIAAISLRTHSVISPPLCRVFLAFSLVCPSLQWLFLLYLYGLRRVTSFFLPRFWLTFLHFFLNLFLPTGTFTNCGWRKRFQYVFINVFVWVSKSRWSLPCYWSDTLLVPSPPNNEEKPKWSAAAA